MDKKFFLRVGILALVLGAGSCHRGPKANVVSGTIETDEAHVASRYGGRVVNIFAQEGDSLKTGQVIVELDAAELQTRRDQAAATLAEMVAGPRKDEIDAAKNDWQSQQADMELARADSKRAVELYAQKTISETERDRAVSHAETLEKGTAAAKNRYDLLVEGTRPERIDLARAQLAEIETQLHEMKICAQTNSVLEVLSVKVGDVLAPNREVATLILHAASLGARLCSRIVARHDPSGRGGESAGGFVSRKRILKARSSKSTARRNSRRAMCRPWMNASNRSSA